MSTLSEMLGSTLFKAQKAAAELARAAGQVRPFNVAKNKYTVQLIGEQLFWMMRAYGYRSEGLRVLEPFAGLGLSLSHTYLHRVAQADFWVLMPEWAKLVQTWGPNVVAHVGDSFRAINGADPRLGAYDVIILDNNLGGVYGEEKYCEHFDLMPAVFRYFPKDAPGVLVMNYVRDVDAVMTDVRFKVEDTVEEHKRRRIAFYGTPDSVVSPEQAVAAYARQAAVHGRKIARHALVPRAEHFAFLMLFTEPA